MPRYKLTIEYDGTPYAGWQIQKDCQTVQGRLAESIKAFSGEQIIPDGAGRTDAGVHALGQVAHLDLEKSWRTDVVRDAVNAKLRPDPIAVVSAEIVGSDFDARFSAIRRHYTYKIVVRRAPLALDKNRVWLVHRHLEVADMNEAAQLLVGEHDFTTFRAAACQARSPVKTLDLLKVSQEDDKIYIRAAARSFLHSQVRSMVGSLKLVGEGKWPVAKIRQILEQRDRNLCGALAPPHGLYLAQVDYETRSSED